jgi:hypothetical protein
MKRTFQCAFVAATVLMSSSAFAQNFGDKGQLAVSAERLFGFSYSTVKFGDDESIGTTGISLLSSQSSQGFWTAYSAPRVAGDYFIIDRLSLGAALGYSHWSTSLPTGLNNVKNTVSGDAFVFAPRVGYALTFTDLIGFWPRAGFSYLTASAANDSLSSFALTLEAPFTFTPVRNVVFWAGPTLDLGLTGSSSTEQANDTKVSRDFKATQFGIQTAMLVYFDL